jgi:predicted  nucleic acid-binding Zn-ribbon protein
MNPLKHSLDSDVEGEGEDIVKKLEKKSKNISEQKKKEAEVDSAKLKRKAKYNLELDDLTEDQIFNALSGGKSNLVIARKQQANQTPVPEEGKKKRKL